MDPSAEIFQQGADPTISTAYVDAKRLLRSAMLADTLSMVLADGYPSSCVAPVPPLDDDNLLQEILLRLPPMPSSLPRASLACKRWRRIITDPRFLRCFRKRHRKPPLIGFFAKEFGKYPVFTPMLDPPDRIPAARFVLPPNLRIRSTLGSVFLGCCDGVALFLDRTRREVILWDPLSGHQRRVAFPAGCQYCHVRSARMLCGAGGSGDCYLSPFKLVLVWHDAGFKNTFTCLYESESGVWGDIISTATTAVISWNRPSILVGNALCWLLLGDDILEFDFERLTLAVIEKPVDAHVSDFHDDWSFQILQGEDNSLGLAILSDSTRRIRLWARKYSCDGVVSWVLQNSVHLDELFVSWAIQNTVQLDELLSQPVRPGPRKLVLMSGYDEDRNVIFLSCDSHDFAFWPESMQISYIGTREYKGFRTYYPYTRFYTAVGGAANGDVEPKMDTSTSYSTSLSCAHVPAHEDEQGRRRVSGAAFLLAVFSVTGKFTDHVLPSNVTVGLVDARRLSKP